MLGFDTSGLFLPERFLGIKNKYCTRQEIVHHGAAIARQGHKKKTLSPSLFLLVVKQDAFWQVYNICEGQDKVMLATLLYTAARRGEIFRLLWSDIDFTHQTIRLSTKKRLDGTMEYDILPMSDKLMLILIAHRAAHPQRSNYVFLNQAGGPYLERKRFMPMMCRLAEVKHFGFHAIRHITATVLYHDGCEIATIQTILRHHSSSTTENYLKTLSLEKVKPALDRLANIVNFDFSKKKKPAGEPTALLQTYNS